MGGVGEFGGGVGEFGDGGTGGAIGMEFTKANCFCNLTKPTRVQQSPTPPQITVA